ncbi:MAG: hypothetical protein Q9192_005851, partial [Flavoplaca navasiana]
MTSQTTQSGANVFAVPAREGHLVFVTSEDQIREVENSPIDQLSFHQAIEDVGLTHPIKRKQNTINWPINLHDAVPTRVLKTLLRLNIPSLWPRVQEAIDQAFEICMHDGQLASDGWKPINTYHFSEEISLQVNCKIIFGERLTENPDFFQATRNYHRQALFAMLTSHYFPHWTHQLLVPGLMALGGAMKKIERYLTVEVRQRLHDIDRGHKEIPRKVLRDFTFADGTHVPAGNVICVPQQAVMRDSKYYDRPDDFVPFRFAKECGVGYDVNQKFTDLKPHFYLWGATAKP